MKILHFFDDWKLTGAVDPTLELLAELCRQGHEVRFFCRRPPPQGEGRIAARAAELGLRAEEVFAPSGTLGPLSEFKPFSEAAQGEADVLHVHTSRTHLLGCWFRVGRRGPPLLVRTNHSGGPLRVFPPAAPMLRKYTDGWIEVSIPAIVGDRIRLSLDAERTFRMPLAVDLEKFHPGRDGTGVRAGMGLPPDAVLLGIVARVQAHRRFDLLLSAFAIAARAEPRLHLAIIGRGTRIEELAVRPVREMGLENRVRFTGYLKEGYPAALAALDAKIFLVPGSDGSCRAVREAMAAGKPVVATRRGVLPELVGHGVTGFVVDEEAESLAQAFFALGTDGPLRRRMGEAARRKAEEEFRPDRQAREVAAFYERLGELKGGQT